MAPTGTAGFATAPNDVNAGGPTNPVASIRQAVTLAASALGARNHIRVLSGNYTDFGATPISLVNNVTIDGDYQIVAGEWVKNSSLVTNIAINFAAEFSATTGSNDIEHGIGF